MKKIWYLFVALLVFTACNNDEPEPVVEKANRTVLAYLVSNNKAGVSLDNELKDNICWMYQGLTQMKGACNLLIYYRPYAGDGFFEGPSVIRFQNDGKGKINGHRPLSGSYSASDVLKEAEVLKVYNTVNHNALDPAIMTTVLKDMVSLSAGSLCYGLVFGSHGTSWMPGDKTISRSFGDDNMYSINIPEMAEAIKSAYIPHLDFVYFDACMMGTAEVMYQFRNLASYCVASVCETHVYGFPYNKIIPLMYSDNVTDYTVNVCKEIVSYADENKLWSTIAAIDLAQMEGLAYRFNELLTANSSRLTLHEITDIQQYGVRSYSNFSYDLLQTAELLNGGEAPATFVNQLDKTVLYADAVSHYSLFDVDKEHYCGIGGYIPQVPTATKSVWNTYFQNNLEWSEAAGWNSISWDWTTTN